MQAQIGAAVGSHFWVVKFLNFVHILAALEYKLHFRVQNKVLVKMVWLIIVKLLYTSALTLNMCFKHVF